MYTLVSILANVSYTQSLFHVIISVVDVEDDCRWPALTNVLYSMDDEYSALPLYGCENFAKELDVELTGLTRDFGNGTLHVTDMLFYTTGNHHHNSNQLNQNCSEKYLFTLPVIT